MNAAQVLTIVTVMLSAPTLLEVSTALVIQDMKETESTALVSTCNFFLLVNTSCCDVWWEASIRFGYND